MRPPATLIAPAITTLWPRLVAVGTLSLLLRRL
jgi:hypothetical protein